jgi:hypothetical protein
MKNTTTALLVRQIAAKHILDFSDNQIITISVEDLVALMVETFERASDTDPTWGHF